MRSPNSRLRLNCHAVNAITTASGGGKLKAFGEKFKANGYKVK
jgi:hypothetical protein